MALINAFAWEAAKIIVIYSKGGIIKPGFPFRNREKEAIFLHGIFYGLIK